MAETQQPTDEGRHRYNEVEPTGYYEGIPCTCRPDCPTACKGECGCRACRAAYNDAREWD